MRTNPLRERLAAGTPALGGWLAIPSSVTAEALAATDLDYLCVDMQHGLVDYNDSVPMLQAITLGSATPMVRVPENTPSHISKALDAGAMAVVVPMVNTRQQCEDALASSYYAPKGGRSYGPQRAAAVEGPDYFDRANTDVLCLPMIETAEALENLDDILSVDGLEAIYVGPNDLRISLGCRPDDDDPVFLDALATIVAACERHGVIPGMHATAGTAADRIERGYKVVTVLADLGVLRSAAKDAVSVARGHSASGGESLY